MNQQMTPTITRRLGRQSDLARELGITASAVSQLCKKYGVPKDIGGFIDLDYAAFLVRQKGNEKKQQAQRAKPKPAPRPETWDQRDFIARLCPIWQTVIEQVLSDYDDYDMSATDQNEVLDVLVSCWQHFHNQLDRVLFNQVDITASQWPQPPIVAEYMDYCEQQFFETQKLKGKPNENEKDSKPQY